MWPIVLENCYQIKYTFLSLAKQLYVMIERFGKEKTHKKKCKIKERKKE